MLNKRQKIQMRSEVSSECRASEIIMQDQIIEEIKEMEQTKTEEALQ